MIIRGLYGTLITAMLLQITVTSFLGLQNSRNISSYGIVLYSPEQLLKLHVEGNVVKDSAGNKVRITGFSGHPWHDRASEYTLTESDIRWMADKGFNTLRAVLYWHQWEPVQGQIDETYFSNYLDPMISWCEKYGIYVILDMHQWKASPYFGGYGFPTWCCDTYPNTDDGMTQFVIDFWKNTGDATVAHQAYVDNWRYIANRYKGRAVIAGYELFNEPPADGFVGIRSQPELASYIMNFYNNELVPTIRSVDPDTIIFYDAISSGYPYTEEYNTKQQHSNIAWCRSQYDMINSYQNGESNAPNELNNYVSACVQKYIVDFGCPYFASEVGWQVNSATVEWLDDTLSFYEEKASDKYAFHYAWWRYSLGLEDWAPRKADGTDTAIVPILQKYVIKG